MMTKTLVLAAAATLTATGAQAATVFGVDEFNNLVTFDSASAATTQSSVAITGTRASVGAIDFRPINGALYGLGLDRIVYTINTATGAATAVSGPLSIMGSEFAFDFNPSIDRLRIVSNTNQNYVFNPNDSSLSQVTSVFYGADDANAGMDPEIGAAAYTGSTFGGPTQLYSIDTNLDVLTTQANSAGTLGTVGRLGVDLGSRTSFDISGSGAFVQNGRNFYSVDLATGALTSLGMTDRSLFGIAVSAVPEPATWGMMILGFGVVGGAMRRRPRVAVRFA